MHTHSHGHHCHHHHHSGDTKALTWAFFLNLGFAIVELIGGFLTGSFAVTSDALHDFGDAIIIGVALILEKKSLKASDINYSYGYRRYRAVSALITGFVLFGGAVGILVSAIPRISNPGEPHSLGMILLALLGVSVNGFAAFKLFRQNSVSQKMILLHLLEDVLGWVVVLLGAVAIQLWNIPVIDPILGCLLALWVIYNVFKNFRVVFDILLQKAPGNLSIDDISAQIRKMPSVQGVHHCHLWSIDGEQHVFTAHVVVHAGMPMDEIDQLRSGIKLLIKQWGIIEATIEVEYTTTICVDPSHDSQ